MLASSSPECNAKPKALKRERSHFLKVSRLSKQISSLRGEEQAGRSDENTQVLVMELSAAALKSPRDAAAFRGLECKAPASLCLLLSAFRQEKERIFLKMLHSENIFIFT